MVSWGEGGAVGYGVGGEDGMVVPYSFDVERMRPLEGLSFAYLAV